MSTGATFSLLILFGGCDFSAHENNRQTKVIKIGVQSDLMSFDPFSFQALGEKNITELLYDRLIYFQNNKIKSDFDIKLEMGDGFVVFEGLSPTLIKKVQNIFLKSRASVLWKDLFEPFEFVSSVDSSHKKKFKITYDDPTNFISNLKSLAPLLVVKGGVFGAYKVRSFQKGIKVVLVKNESWFKTEPRAEKLIIQKVKSTSDGFKQVSQNNVDAFVPIRATRKGDVEPYKSKLVFHSSSINQQKLRLYSKYSAYSPLKTVFCLSRKEIEKVLETNWKLSQDSCNQKPGKSVARDLRIIMSSDYGQQILDILAQIYLKKSGKKINYEVLDSLRLSEKLKSGDFDHYLSIDVETQAVPVLFDSFHSLGRYNSLNIEDPKLDKLLEKASKARSMEDFTKFERLARARLKKVLPYVFEFSRPHLDFVVHKKRTVKLLKSSKVLMKFQN